MEQNSTEINPHFYSELIFIRRSKYIQWAKDSLFNKDCWENWTDTSRKMKLDHLLTPHTRMNSKWIQDLNVILKIIKILEKTLAAKSQTLPVEIFYGIYLSRQGKENKKITKLDYIKLKSFAQQRKSLRK